MTQHMPFEDRPDPGDQARQLLERYGWRLLTPADLAERARGLAAAGDADGLPRALVGAYCLTLYAAFMGHQGPERQRLACDELGQALAAMLRRSHPGLPADERQDVTQNALERVWRARASCRQPIAFLAFAGSHLRTAATQTRRQLQRLGEPLPAAGDGHDPLEIPDEAPAPLALVLEQERRADIARFLAELRRARPRARDQIAILELRWLQELSYPEICARLNTSPAVAQTKLSRIRHTIRNDPALLRRARELGLSDLERDGAHDEV